MSDVCNESLSFAEPANQERDLQDIDYQEHVEYYDGNFEGQRPILLKKDSFIMQSNNSSYNDLQNVEQILQTRDSLVLQAEQLDMQIEVIHAQNEPINHSDNGSFESEELSPDDQDFSPSEDDEFQLVADLVDRNLQILQTEQADQNSTVLEGSSVDSAANPLNDPQLYEAFMFEETFSEQSNYESAMDEEDPPFG
jgi:hypothetical protein